MEQECLNCRFWHHDGEYHDSEDVGACRRYPPKIVTPPIISRKDGEPTQTPANPRNAWPMLSYVNWCGEWQQGEER